MCVTSYHVFAHHLMISFFGFVNIDLIFINYLDLPRKGRTVNLNPRYCALFFPAHVSNANCGIFLTDFDQVRNTFSTEHASIGILHSLLYITCFLHFYAVHQLTRHSTIDCPIFNFQQGVNDIKTPNFRKYSSKTFDHHFTFAFQSKRKCHSLSR